MLLKDELDKVVKANEKLVKTPAEKERERKAKEAAEKGETS